MVPLSLLTLVKSEETCNSVDLFNLPLDTSVTKLSSSNSDSCANGYLPNGITHQKQHKKKPVISLVVDSESCLDRLYGGYYSDWASGGQWNRMLNYAGNLYKACTDKRVGITVAFRGGVEREHAQQILCNNKDFRDRLNRVMMHLHNRGTPPPKVWWLPPTCLREVLILALQFHGVPVLCTSGDYYKEVMEYVRSNDVQGILSDDGVFALLNPPRLFAAHDFKLTYKGTLETREYLLDEWLKENKVDKGCVPLLASLLGNHLVPVKYLKEFHEEVNGNSSETKSSEDSEVSTVREVVNFVKKFCDVTNLEAIGNVVFRNSSCSIEEGIEMLKKSVEYFKEFSDLPARTDSLPQAVTSEINVTPVSKTSTEENGDVNGKLSSSSTNNSIHSNTKKKSESTSKDEDQSAPGPSGDGNKDNLSTNFEKLNMNGDVTESEGADIHVQITPSEAILKLAMERHRLGLMSPLILQALVQREVRLTPCIENDDAQSIINIYLPIRKSIYAILHNLNKHLYDTKKTVEESNKTVNSHDISIQITEHYVDGQGEEVCNTMDIKPVTWPVPSIESLWLGVKPENKLRRMKAFLSCMQTGSDPHLTNISHVPERFLLLCCVLRYLLKADPAVISLKELDAVLAMATSNILFDVQTMQDMQLPLITPRGSHVASVVMAGVQHAMLVNDVCGAPIRKDLTSPWLFFDGKLFQYKLLKASAHNAQRLELCDGQMAQLIQMERLRQVILYGLQDRYGEHVFATTFPGALPSRMLVAPTAFLRPIFTSDSRGKGSLLGDFVPNSSPLDNRGGKLQVAGQVVATWGPRPNNFSGGKRDLNSSTASSGNSEQGQQSPQKQTTSRQYSGGKKYTNHHTTRQNNSDKGKQHNMNNIESKEKSTTPTATRPVTIATKPDRGEQLDVKVLPDEELADGSLSIQDDKNQPM